MNPDLKVYVTTIAIEGVRDWLKPGMSSKVEILVDRLPDVVYIPIQAITPMDGKQFCYVLKAGGQEQREVEAGDFNDEFIEIKKGIQEGEQVCLRAPEESESAPGGKTKNPEKDKPAGENGTYFQTVPFWNAAIDPTSRLEAGTSSLQVGRAMASILSRS
jgi:hypothetical protein